MPINVEGPGKTFDNMTQTKIALGRRGGGNFFPTNQTNLLDFSIIVI